MSEPTNLAGSMSVYVDFDGPAGVQLFPDPSGEAVMFRFSTPGGGRSTELHLGYDQIDHLAALVDTAKRHRDDVHTNDRDTTTDLEPL